MKISVSSYSFEQYINGQLQKIQLPNKDEDYLRTKMLEMYANPALNQMSVVKG